MTMQTRYRVVTDLTPQEYEEHRTLANADDHRFPPMLEMPSEYRGTRFTEKDIPSLVADAVICSPRFTRENKINAEDSCRDYDSSDWPLELKADVMKAARQGWHPGNTHELSEWRSADHANSFMDQVPEMAEMFEKPAQEIIQTWRERKEPQNS